MRNQLEGLMAQAHTASLLDRIRAEDVLEQAITIQQIPAPTFYELERASYILSRVGGRTLKDVGCDSVYNVYARLPGADPARPALLISAHIDTVFGKDTDLTISRDDKCVYGPGLSDNSLGVAAMLALADALERARFEPPCDVWFVANTREEGLGDLGGIRAVMERLRDRLGAAVILEGLGLGRVCHGGVAVRRYKITCTGEGGHSWMHFGRPNAIHALMQLGARLTDLQTPTAPRSTFNIGLIEGGTSINTIAPEASLYLDLRSETADGLAALERQVRALVDDAHADDLEMTLALVGDRPAALLAVDHWLVQGAGAALEMIGIEPSYSLASTDANAILAAGVPAVTLGVSHGGNAHRRDEYVEVAPIALGMRQLTLLTLLALEQLAVT